MATMKHLSAMFLSYFFLLKQNLYVWFTYDLGQKYHAPQVQPGRGLNSWPPDHDSTFHVAALTTQPSVNHLID